MSGLAISSCDCDHKEQDKLHGKQRRVFTKTEKRSGEQHYYRCTVCLREKIIDNERRSI